MVNIIQKEDPILRSKAIPVSIKDISSPRLKKIIKDMKGALASQEDGVAIAAPQIGVSLRIFVISGKIYSLLDSDDQIKDKKEFEGAKDIICINPKIIKISREKSLIEEGCLSVRYLYGQVKRAKKARIEAFDENGKRFELGGSGILAQIFQHEIDHLEGILFTDKATNVHELLPHHLHIDEHNEN